MGNIKIVLEDITKSDCECIVNAANSSLLGGGAENGTSAFAIIVYLS